MREQWKKNLERKIANQVERINEIEEKKERLEATRRNLEQDLRKNLILLEQGPEVPKLQQSQELSEEKVQENLLAATSFFSKSTI